MKKRDIVAPANLTRRRFLEATGLLTLGLALPSPWFAGCGDDGGGGATALPPLTVDPNTPWWLQNNFDPVFDEIEAFDLPVQGRIPSEVMGTYVRNGSNPRGADSPHWFFGDGMLHGVRFENGRAVWYRNRWVETGFDPDSPPIGSNNPSNVSPVYHAGKLLTSGEVGAPYLIDPADLSTIGSYDFEGALKRSFTAHPKIDPVTGYLHFFGYWFSPPYLNYYVADQTGRVIRVQDIPVAASTMMHSFAITESDVVFWELPVLFSVEAAIAGAGLPFEWKPDYGARIGVMPFGGTAEELRWVEIEPCYVFHEVNAFRRGDDVLIDVCRHNRMFDGNELYQNELKIHRWTVNTTGPNLQFSDQVVTDRQFELPTHDRRFTGRQHRYGWFGNTRPHPDTIDFAGAGFIDYASGNIRTWDPGPTRHDGEFLFVPGGAGEGEGWLLTFVYDHATDESTLVILDALGVESGPIAEVQLPQRVPYGFHGTWIPG